MAGTQQLRPISPLGTDESFETVTFDVVKRHHRMSWLKQRRLLVITADTILNCKPPGEPGAAPTVTKSHQIQDVVSVSITTKRLVRVTYKNDHDYFYSTPEALGVVWEIRRRIFAHQAAERLAGPGMSVKRERLLRLFASGKLELPQMSQDDAGDDAIMKHVAVVRAMRAGVLWGSAGIGQFLHELLTCDAAASGIALEEVREGLDSMKVMAVSHLLGADGGEAGGESEDANLDRAVMAKCPLPQFADAFEAERSVEDALQQLIVQPAFDVLWQQLQLDSGIVEQENVFMSQCELLLQQPLEFFGVHQRLAVVKYDLVLHELSQLPLRRTPSAMLDCLVAVAKSIVLCVRAAHQATPSSSTTTVEVMPLAADDVLPLYIYIMCHSQVRGLIFAREMVSRLGDSGECSERSYYFTMFCSALEYISTCEATQGSAEDESDPAQQQQQQQREGKLRSATYVHSPFTTPLSCSDSPCSSPILRDVQAPNTIPSEVEAIYSHADVGPRQLMDSTTLLPKQRAQL